MSDRDWEALERTDWLFRKMVRRFVKERDRISVEGISLPGMLILHKIIREGEQRLGDLAEQLDFTSGAITALTDKLEKRDSPSADERKTIAGRFYWTSHPAGGRCMRETATSVPDVSRFCLRVLRVRNWSSKVNSTSG